MKPVDQILLAEVLTDVSPNQLTYARAEVRSDLDALSACDGADDEQWLGSGRNRIWEAATPAVRSKILLAGEEADHRAALQVTWSRIVPRSIG